MKTIFEHIERVKSQPHHIRKQIAFASAAAGTIIIALVWLAGSLATGAFAINGNSFVANAEKSAATSDNLAGVGAASAIPDTASVPAHI